MTQSKKQPCVRAAMAFLIAATCIAQASAQHPGHYAGSQTSNPEVDLPPTLRAAQELNQQSGGVIDQLLQSSQQQHRQEHIQPQSITQRPPAYQPTANDLRMAGLRERHASELQNRSAQPLRQEASKVAPRDQFVQTAAGQVDPRVAANPRVAAVAFEQPADRTMTAKERLESKSDEAWDQILRSSSAATNDLQAAELTAENAAALGVSFIDKEKADPKASDKSTSLLIKKISINLMFVLAAAFCVLLLIRQWQNAKGRGKATLIGSDDSLNVSQILPLSNGASLHIVQGSTSKFLVAIDAGGIKSVNVLNSSSGEQVSFEDAMEQVETRQQRRQSHQATSAYKRNSPEQNENGPSEIDEKLIKMLLQRTSAAA